MENEFVFAGLFFTLVGSRLLYFYGLPQKNYENVIFYGPLTMIGVPVGGQRDIQKKRVGANAK